MLRLPDASHAKDVRGVHDPKHPVAANPLHRLGQGLPLFVGFGARSHADHFIDASLLDPSQIFGPVTEDEDVSKADLGSDNGTAWHSSRAGLISKADLAPGVLAEEIENLKREAAATKELRSKVGSKDFPEVLFDKVGGTRCLRRSWVLTLLLAGRFSCTTWSVSFQWQIYGRPGEHPRR